MSAREALDDQAATQHAIRGLHLGAMPNAPAHPRGVAMPVRPEDCYGVGLKLESSRVREVPRGLGISNL